MLQYTVETLENDNLNAAKLKTNYMLKFFFNY